MSYKKKSIVPVACVLLFTASATAQQYGSGGAYEAELRRRQMEYAQAQALRQQQAQQQQYQQQAYKQQAQQQQYQQQARAQQQQSNTAYQQQLRAQQQQAALQAAQQQMLREEMMREAAMRSQGSKSGGLSAQGGQKNRALSKKEKAQQLKQQAAAKKQAEAQAAKAAKANKAAAAQRQKQFETARRAASKRMGAGGVRPKRTSDGKGPLGFVLSFKGAALLGGVGYLYIAQREVLLRLLGMLLKYPLLIASAIMSKGWTLVLKPILRKLIALRGSSGAVGAAAASAGLGGAELPGGSY